MNHMWNDTEGTPLAGRIHHPGTRIEPRRTVLPVGVQTVEFGLKAGESLHAAIVREAAAQQADAAFVVLAGVRLAPCAYVLPAGPVSAEHVAWYSARHLRTEVEVATATAIVGRKDGEWFVHCHAVWHADGETGMGHLLNQECIVGASCLARMHVVKGGALTVARDPETHFPLFRVDPTTPASAPNGALLLVRPHEDLRATIDAVALELGIRDARMFGIGSLEGAAFHDGPAMHSSLSEIVVLPAAEIRNGQCQTLPVTCVTPEETTFSGDLRRGCGAVLITCELLLVEG